MRSLDADRKALVYDNYSKLIAATETIRRMTSVGATEGSGVGAAGATLAPAVAHIEEVAGRILRDGEKTQGKGAVERRKGDKVVAWVMAAPELVTRLRQEGRKEDAVRVWERLKGILEVWEKKGVKGVEELRKKGEEAASGL